MTTIHPSKKHSHLGGQFDPVSTGQFEPVRRGQFKPAKGGQLQPDFATLLLTLIIIPLRLVNVLPNLVNR